MRVMTEYYKEKLEEGISYQDFVYVELYKIGLPVINYSSKEFQHKKGENLAGIEIKFDQKFRDTHNLYIETAEKTNANNTMWVSSGIYRNDNSWLYIIGDYKTIYIFSKKQLKDIKENYHQSDTNPTSKGYLLPIRDAERDWAIKIIYPKEKNGMAEIF